MSELDEDRLWLLAQRLAELGWGYRPEAPGEPPRYVSDLPLTERAQADRELAAKRELAAAWQELSDEEREWVTDTAARIRGMHAMYSNVIAEATWLGKTKEERDEMD